jgi:hypothetical protein
VVKINQARQNSLHLSLQYCPGSLKLGIRHLELGSRASAILSQKRCPSSIELNAHQFAFGEGIKQHRAYHDTLQFVTMIYIVRVIVTFIQSLQVHQFSIRLLDITPSRRINE